ncbi:NAD(P)-dependent oxidoreductase [Candidatus Woesebacteria bacterium]|nr:NAD(P)-dependent oxidoreductase [Candidatus Woesebacteria bacterium]MCD8506847.1 NAD(P)-dependent oxidoreductase [Candidatus Woesebacteria bacterium]MCD8527534.1 NAD(P)-dependent oxidoreductase [Candidatus Woesebacteria bacterium]MCD8546274.1 NAD(P)-dependent oxidoreductase [Candidatus Woesebacteria bacterium]
MNLEGKKIVITGGTGFIGTRIVERLLSLGAEVISISRKERTSHHPCLHFVQCDLFELSLKEYEALADRIGETESAIFAAASILPRSEGVDSLIAAKEKNFDSFLYFLETVGKNTKKVVFTSTIDIYGVPEHEEYSEDHRIQPESSYGVAKYAAETYLEYWSRMNSIPYTGLRFSQVYGPNEPLVRVIPFAVQSWKEKKVFRLLNEGVDKRRFLYVEDAASAVMRALDVNTNTFYNIAGEDVVTIRDIVSSIEALTGSQMEIENVVEENRQPVHNVPSIEKAKSELGFRPEYSFVAGMKEVLKELYEHEEK